MWLFYTEGVSYPYFKKVAVAVFHVGYVFGSALVFYTGIDKA
ncbi:MAG: hypothetical protein JWP37_2605 [Mucilaginibacter sp.]|nr:hypothetical protein [Mucilaginibacter sp.]